MKSEFEPKTHARMASSDLVSENEPIRQIVIGKPYIETQNDHAYLKCNITIGDVQKEIFFCVEQKYKEYLCFERCDAFLIGILNCAMRERCNIRCEAPVTTELLYQLQTELIPTLVKYAPRLYVPCIEAEACDIPLECAGRIATGCSCGIDSLYSIKMLSNASIESMRIDCLVINNVGAFTVMGETSRRHYLESCENAKEFAREYGYELIITDSNFAEAIPQEHLKTHLYSSAFAVYALRKLWKRYYYASDGCDLEAYFGLRDNELYDAAKYSLIALPCLSIPQLRICNSGLEASRYEKTKELACWEPAWRHLNVCLKSGKGNCGRCAKCRRTLWMLDALGALEEFRGVFDVDYYMAHHYGYMVRLGRDYIMQKKTGMLEETFLQLRKQTPLLVSHAVVALMRVPLLRGWMREAGRVLEGRGGR